MALGRNWTLSVSFSASPLPMGAFHVIMELSQALKGSLPGDYYVVSGVPHYKRLKNRS